MPTSLPPNVAQITTQDYALSRVQAGLLAGVRALLAFCRGLQSGLTGETVYVTAVGSAATPASTITWGTGSPAGVVAAAPGSLYLNLSGGAGATLYVKESGTSTSGWVAK